MGSSNSSTKKEDPKPSLFDSLANPNSKSSKPEKYEVPKDASLEDIVKKWEALGKPAEYSTFMENLLKLIEAEKVALSMEERKGAKYGQAIKDWIAKATACLNTLPPYYGYQQKPDDPKWLIREYYNKVMDRRTADFQKFAGSSTPAVVLESDVRGSMATAEKQIKELKTEQSPAGAKLLMVALSVTDSIPTLVNLSEKYVDNVDDLIKQNESLEEAFGSVAAKVASQELANALADSLEKHREAWISFCSENEDTGMRALKIVEMTKDGPILKDVKAASDMLMKLDVATMGGMRQSQATRLKSKLRTRADDLTDLVATEAKEIVQKLKAPTQQWRREFGEISGKQVNELRNNRSVNDELKKNKMSILFVSWSDVGRAKGSCVGPNITDMQFFAVPPLKLRPAAPNYTDLDRELFCGFPAVRSPNFTDEVDIRTAKSYTFKVRDLQGDIKEVSMAYFLKNLGRYITDLDPKADWGDKIDLEKEKMQVASQFSVLPLLQSADGRAELGISAFGYQQKNLHIVIGPNGDLGWAPEGRGYKRIFFRDTSGTHDAVVKALDGYFGGSKYICNIISRYCLGWGQELRAIALVPEDRKEVSNAFFKPPPKNETIEEEAKRYKKVENKLIHIQIEMKRGAEVKDDFNKERMFSCDGLTNIAKQLAASKNVQSAVEQMRLSAKAQADAKLNSLKLNWASVKSPEFGPQGGYDYPMALQCSGIMPGSAMPEAGGFGGAYALKSSSLGFGGGYKMMTRSRGAARGRAAPMKKKEVEDLDLGLLLARVKMGDSVGRADHTDLVPRGATRAEGVAVRVTEMFYSVAKNAVFTQPRIYRFMQQMSFAKRAGNLQHGSLVTGEGNWEKEPPITLAYGY